MRRYLRAVVSCRRPKSRCAWQRRRRSSAARWRGSALRRSGHVSRCAHPRRVRRSKRRRASSLKMCAILHSAAPNGERLARTLRWDCGASVHTLQTDERIAADLSVCFDDFPLPDGLVLPLGSGAVSVAYGTENLGDAAMIWNEDQLICALYASLARRADEIWVKDVKMPPDGGENANLP